MMFHTQPNGRVWISNTGPDRMGKAMFLELLIHLKNKFPRARDDYEGQVIWTYLTTPEVLQAEVNCFVVSRGLK